MGGGNIIFCISPFPECHMPYIPGKGVIKIEKESKIYLVCVRHMNCMATPQGRVC